MNTGPDWVARKWPTSATRFGTVHVPRLGLWRVRPSNGVPASVSTASIGPPGSRVPERSPRRGQATTGSSAQPGSSGATVSHPSIATSRAGSTPPTASRCAASTSSTSRPSIRSGIAIASSDGDGPAPGRLDTDSSDVRSGSDARTAAVSSSITAHPTSPSESSRPRGRRSARTYQIVPTSRGTAASAAGSIVASWSRSTITSVSTIAPRRIARSTIGQRTMPDGTGSTSAG